MEQKLNDLLDAFAKLNGEKNDAQSSEHYDFIIESISKTRQEIIELFNNK